jgi:uncharacterized protein YggT (Ycf19 family)
VPIPPYRLARTATGEPGAGGAPTAPPVAEGEEPVSSYDAQPSASSYRPPVKGGARSFAWGVGRVIVWVVYVFAIVAIVIAAMAFVLQLLGANPESGFAQWVYRSAARVTAPFRGIFPSHETGASVLDVSLLFAILMYALFALFVHALIDWIDRQRVKSLSRDLYEAEQAAQQRPATA